MIPRQSLGPLPPPLPLPLPPWTLNPVCRQDRIRAAHSGLKSPLLTRNARTSRPKISASRASSKRGSLWKIPARPIEATIKSDVQAAYPFDSSIDTGVPL